VPIGDKEFFERTYIPVPGGCEGGDVGVCFEAFERGYPGN